MVIFVIISVNKNIVQIDNDKDVKLLNKNFVNISLETYWYVCLPKKHHLVLEMTVSSSERRLLFIPFTDFHLIVCTCKVELDKLFSPS